jgi:uncharacterized membrane protein YfcA
MKEKMGTDTIIILALIGVFAGILSGFVGIGGGVVIVPALVYFLGLTQHQAQGTSLFVLVMPVVFLALMNYWKSGNVNWQYGLIIALTFVVGGFFGSKLALKLSPGIVKLVFGILMAYVSFRLIMTGFNSLSNDK